MSFDADEEILQDFLVEAGEILELLSEQLVELESSPDDMALLNAIFRGFHTVKGGAGFLQLHELVECCHIAENVFDILRKGERRVDSELMDVVLQALDAVNEMFSQVRERVEPTPASPELLAALARLAEPASADAAPVVPAAPQVVAEPEAEPAGADSEFEQLLDAIQPAASETAGSEAEHGPVTDEITDDEFESLLDQLHGKGQFSAPASAAAPAVPVAPDAAAAKTGDEITDEEFEALLDQLHGKGKFEPVGSVAGSSAEAAGAESAKDSAPAASGDEITDDEFEALLDQLHGKGKFEPAVADASPAEPVAAAPAKAAPKAEPARAAAPAKPAAAASKAAAPAPAAADKAPAEVETTVRVDTARLDEIMNMVGELVLV
ncbi:MAG TPA: chemotaxis protein CheA, partial [Pseudomonas sp.]|nr:chemotaxis protein CheA [Pseudomonas sp.]